LLLALSTVSAGAQQQQPQQQPPPGCFTVEISHSMQGNPQDSILLDRCTGKTWLLLRTSAGGTGTLRNVARFGVLLAAKVVTGRKRNGAGLANEQHFPHLVEVAVSPEGLRDALLEFDAFHRERRIPVHPGRSRHVAEAIPYSFLALPLRTHCAVDAVASASPISGTSDIASPREKQHLRMPFVLSARMRLLLRSASGIGAGRKRRLTARKP
jgi:hypothetical protein